MNNKGFALIILIVIIGSLVVGGGWYYIERQSRAPSQAVTNVQSVSSSLDSSPPSVTIPTSTPKKVSASKINRDSFNQVLLTNKDPRCPSSRVELYIIDDRMVLADFAGVCSSETSSTASRILYGENSGKILCMFIPQAFQLPAGSCADSQHQAIFNTIMNNRDKPDFGLGPSHVVAKMFTNEEMEARSVLVLDEVLTRGRDQNRLSDLSSINSGVSLYLAEGYKLMCDEGRVYKSTSGSISIDGSGWLPVDFRKISVGAPLQNLEVDPMNDAEFYYSFACIPGTNRYELNMKPQSGITKDLAMKDKGNNPNLYEVGTDRELLK